MNFFLELTSKWHIKRRESFDLEFKENFHFGNPLFEYCKSLVWMANNKWGEIIFWVSDKPRIPVWMRNDKFQDCDPSKINQILQEYFSHEIEWEMRIEELSWKNFWIITVKEARQKPIICRKYQDPFLKESAIYYRYRWETREIRYTELSSILQQEREKEKNTWMQLIQKIGTAWPQNIHLVDTYKGEIITDKGKILLDETLLKKIKFIKEGEFVEKNGAPALKLVWEISGLTDATMIEPDIAYPYIAQQVQKKCHLKSFYALKLILDEYKIKGNQKFHTAIQSWNNNSIHKYSENLVQWINKLLADNPKIIEKLQEKSRNKIR